MEKNIYTYLSFFCTSIVTRQTTALLKKLALRARALTGLRDSEAAEKVFFLI